ncbi:MAG: glycogen/starch/alpha-glucan phosphorylase [Collinsella sp.]
MQERSAACPLNNGKKKLYYISAEFLIGKLLINNMIDLGIYDEVKDQLTAAGHDLNKIEEFEVEPSLGNGGLGRLAACFLDSIATLGLTGDGVGLNYHYGLFRQRFVDNQQKAVPDEWLGEQDILVDDDHSYTVEFGDLPLPQARQHRCARLRPAHQEPPAPVRPGKRRRRPGPRQLHRLRQDRDRQEPHPVPLPRRF